MEATRTGTVIRQRRVPPVLPTTALTMVIAVAPCVKAGLNVPFVPPPLVTQSIVGGVAVTLPTVIAKGVVGKVSVTLLIVSGTEVLALLMSIVSKLSWF